MVVQVLKKVFSRVPYLALATSVSIAVFVFAVWFPNIGLIARLVGDPAIPFAQKLEIPIAFLGAINTNFTPLSASYTVLTALLFGVNVAMAVYYFKRRVAEVKAGGLATGFLGLASATLGIGCAACGSFVATAILPLFGTGALLSFLPFGGGEFGILGVVLLLVSLYVTAKQIKDPSVCAVDY